MVGKPAPALVCPNEIQQCHFSSNDLKFSRPSPYHHHGSIFKIRPQNNPNYRDLLSATSLYSGILTSQLQDHCRVSKAFWCMKMIIQIFFKFHRGFSFHLNALNTIILSSRIWLCSCHDREYKTVQYQGITCIQPMVFFSLAN